MKRIAIIADIHIGSRPDIKSYYENELVEFIKFVTDNKVDIIIIAGDLFDKRIIKDSDFDTYSNLFINELSRLNKELILLKGTNAHDYNQLNSYLYLQKQNLIKIINTVQELNILGLDFLFIPEEYENNKYEYYKDTVFSDKKYDFVIGHGMFTFAGGYATETGKNNHIVFETKDFVNKVFGKVVFGHVHIHMTKDNCLYVSSYSRDSFGEEKNKGFMYYEYDENKRKIIKEEFVVNSRAPIYKTINSEELSENIEKMTNELLKIKENVFRLRIIINTDISEEKYNNLVSLSYKWNDIVIKKEMKGLKKKEEQDAEESLKKRREERQSKLAKYDKMDFFEVTKSIANDLYKEEYTNNEISEAISN